MKTLNENKNGPSCNTPARLSLTSTNFAGLPRQIPPELRRVTRIPQQERQQARLCVPPMAAIITRNTNSAGDVSANCPEVTPIGVQATARLVEVSCEDKESLREQTRPLPIPTTIYYVQ